MGKFVGNNQAKYRILSTCRSSVIIFKCSFLKIRTVENSRDSNVIFEFLPQFLVVDPRQKKGGGAQNCQTIKRFSNDQYVFTTRGDDISIIICHYLLFYALLLNLRSFSPYGFAFIAYDTLAAFTFNPN